MPPQGALAAEPAALASPASAGPPAAGILTLEEAIELAHAQNRGAQSALVQVQRANGQLAAARALGRPSFNALLLGSHRLHRDRADVLNDAVGLLPAPVLGLLSNEDKKTQGVAAASLMQPITQMRRIRAGAAARRAGVELAQEEVRGQRLEITAQVRTAYHSLLSTQQALESSLLAEKFYAELERTVRDLLAERTVLQADLLDVQARQMRQAQQTVTARNGVATLKERLNMLLGREITTPFEVPPHSPETPPAYATIAPEDGTYWEDRALRQRPEVRRATLTLRQAELDRKAKRSEALPDVSIGLTYATPLNINALPTNNVSIGAVLRWELFDGGRRAGEEKEKSAAVEQARLALLETQAAVRSDVRARMREVSSAQMALRASALEREAALERRRVTQDRFAEKAALLKDVLEAQSRVAEAERRYLDSQLALTTARFNLTKALGDD